MIARMMTLRSKAQAAQQDMVITEFLVDADTLNYKACWATNDKGEDEARGALYTIINGLFLRLEKHLYTKTQRDKGLRLNVFDLIKRGKCKFYLTSNDKTNFRFKIATIQEYKNSRGEKPKHYEFVRRVLIDKFNAEVVSGMEADDMLAIKASEDPEHSVIIGEDKDARQTRCWHYWHEAVAEFNKPPYFVDSPGSILLHRRNGAYHVFATGEYQLAYQMLDGDSSDTIPGIEKGWGPLKCYQFLVGDKHKEATLLPLERVYREYLEVHGRIPGDIRYTEIKTLLTMLDRPVSKIAVEHQQNG